MKVKFTRALGSTTQAAAIKSQSGCLLRKQIAMIIPTCHPPALKHPSIRQHCYTHRPKQSSLSTSLSRTISPTMLLLLSHSLHTFHSSWCVNCLQEREQRWLALWPTPRWQRCTRHTALIVCRLDQSENTLGSFFWTLATQLDGQVLTERVKRRSCQENRWVTLSVNFFFIFLSHT